MTYVHIYAPKPTSVECVVNFCPTCDRLRRMLVKQYEWFGPDFICAGCGDRWSDGEMLERPFMAGWRRKSIEYARKELVSIGVLA